MNRTMKIILAAVLTISLALLATSVWAGKKDKDGSLGPKIHEVHKDCKGNKTINMGDAVFTLITLDSTCYFNVERFKTPHSSFGALPHDLVFRSDGFEVSTNADPATLQVCFPYSPKDDRKDTAIYTLNRRTWVKLGGEVQPGSPTSICVTTSNVNASFALVGKR